MIIREINREEASGIDAFESHSENPIEWSEENPGIDQRYFKYEINFVI